MRPNDLGSEDMYMDKLQHRAFLCSPNLARSMALNAAMTKASPVAAIVIRLRKGAGTKALNETIDMSANVELHCVLLGWSIHAVAVSR